MRKLAHPRRASYFMLRSWLQATRSFAASLVLVALGLGTAMASLKPVPSIGIVVKKNPGGGAERVVTGPQGQFTFSNLRTGSYTLEVAPGGPLRPGQPMQLELQAAPAGRAPSGGELHKLQLTLKPGAGRPVTVEITRDGGQITGTLQVDDTLVLQGTVPAKGANSN